MTDSEINALLFGETGEGSIAGELAILRLANWRRLNRDRQRRWYYRQRDKRRAAAALLQMIMTTQS